MPKIFCLLLVLLTASVQAKQLHFSRDPFIPLDQLQFQQTGTLLDSQDLTVSLVGIIYDESDPAAVISIQRIKQIVYIDDTLADLTIIDIQKKTVTLKADNKTFILAIGEELRQ